MPDQPNPQSGQTQQPGTGQSTDTGSAGAAATGQPNPGGQPGAPQSPAGGQGATPPWGDPANFNPETAWNLIEGLRADKAKQQQTATGLAQQLEQMKTETVSRADLAKAFGVAPEQVSDSDRLTQQVSALTDRLNAAERTVAVNRIAKEHGVPDDAVHLLTATTDEGLAEQAKFLGERLGGQSGQGGDPGQGAPGAAGAGQTAGHLPSNGQGQGGGRPPSIPEQIVAAEAARNQLQRSDPAYAAADQKVQQLKTQQLASLRPQ